MSYISMNIEWVKRINKHYQLMWLHIKDPITKNLFYVHISVYTKHKDYINVWSEKTTTVKGTLKE